MQAYMTVPPTGTPENYTVEYLTDVLHLNHVKIGILTDTLQKIIDNNLYNKEVLVAQGAEAQDGKDGYFEYVYEYDTIGNFIKITYKSTDTNCIYKEVNIKYLY